MGSSIQTALINLILATAICNLQIVAKITCGVLLGSVALLGRIPKVIFYRRSENCMLAEHFTGNPKIWYMERMFLRTHVLKIS